MLDLRWLSTGWWRLMALAAARSWWTSKFKQIVIFSKVFSLTSSILYRYNFGDFCMWAFSSSATNNYHTTKTKTHITIITSICKV
jgi:hypothetical protein